MYFVTCRRNLRTLPFLSRELSTQAHSPSLAGTATSHRSYILLHTSQSPKTFPAKFFTPLQRALQLKVVQWGALVNFVWGPQFAPPKNDGSCSVTAFSSRGGQLVIPDVSLRNLDEIEEQLRLHAETNKVQPDVSPREEIHLYVCTHQNRDCRCGDMGSRVVQALHEEIARRTEAEPSGILSRVKIGEVGHVGGHQYAANLLIFPHGEWLGLVRPEHVREILDKVLVKSPPRPLALTDPPISLLHWRGRMGLSKDEQLMVYNRS